MNFSVFHPDAPMRKELLASVKHRREHKHTLSTWLVYADWLEERGDSLGGLVRRHAAFALETVRIFNRQVAENATDDSAAPGRGHREFLGDRYRLTLNVYLGEYRPDEYVAYFEVMRKAMIGSPISFVGYDGVRTVRMYGKSLASDEAMDVIFGLCAFAERRDAN